MRDQGLAVIDADALAHEALRPGTGSFEQITKTFGQDILEKDGTIQRSALASLVFADEEKKNLLERIIHPYVQQRGLELRKGFYQQGHRIVFYDVPLLFEKNLRDQFDAVIVVTCSESLQIQRMKSRNHWSDQEIKQRLSNQIPMSLKEQGADFIIRNESTIESLKESVATMLVELQKKI